MVSIAYTRKKKDRHTQTRASCFHHLNFPFFFSLVKHNVSLNNEKTKNITIYN